MLRLLLSALLVLSIAACSSKDKSSRAPLTDEQLARAAVDTTSSTLADDSSPDFSFDDFLAKPKSFASKQLDVLPIGATETFGPETQGGDCGGSMVMNGRIDYSGSEQNPFPVTIRADIDFNDFCEDENVINGTASMRMTLQDEQNGSFYVEMDITGMDGSGVPQEFSGAIDCVIAAGVESCTESTWYVAASGHRLELSEFSATGDSQSGYTVAGNLETGSSAWMLDGQNLMTCPGGKFESGTITLYENSEVYMTIVFTGCGAFTYTDHNGESVDVTIN